LPGFRVANIIRDAEVLGQAKEDAFKLAEEDPGLEKPEHRLVKIMLKKRWGRKLSLAHAG
jgi:ATP-dependent DNA helicase RecG